MCVVTSSCPPVLPDNKNDRNCTEMNNLLVCSHSLTGKIKCIKVKTNDVTMYGRSANFNKHSTLFFATFLYENEAPGPVQAEKQKGHFCASP